MLNIKEIVLKAGHSTVPAYWLSDEKPIACSTSNFEKLVSFAEAFIAELAKQNEPVAEVNKYHLKGDEHWCKEVLLYSGNNPGDRPENRAKLFTFPPTAEQIANETAEACAKACEDVIGNTPHDQRMLAAIDCAVMLRSGAWKEFKK